jgi:membrane-associated phospholipid phosphatase
MRHLIQSKIVLFAFVVCTAYSCKIQAQSPYQLNWKKESVFLGTGLISAFAASEINDKVKPLTEVEIVQLNKSSINGIDRSATNNYSRSSSKASDLLVLSCAGSPIFLIAGKQPRKDIGIISVMYFETTLYAVFLPSYGKGTVLRIRPYAYNTSVPLEEKLNTDTRRSFFSGHTTLAFSSAVFLSSVYCKYYPNSKLKPLVWGTTLLAAGTVGFLRYEAGVHYPSDILVGAAVGSAIGFFVPFLHRTRSKNDVSVTPFFQNNKTGLSLVWNIK